MTEVDIDTIIAQKKDEIQRVIGQIEMLTAMKNSGVSISAPDAKVPDEQATDVKE